MRSTSSLAKARAAWRAQLGASAVVDDDDTLARYATATYATSQRVSVVLRPRDAAQVQAALRIAARHAIAVHPVSAGRNWGYGCRVPVHDGAAVLELAALRRIRNLNEELGYVTVEPGVTFRALARYLERRRSQRMMAMIGGSPDASVLGNALERGIGMGPLGNRIEAVCDLDVVLSTGERIRTGFGRLPAARCEHLHRMGIGPSLEGLFSQSSLGVVVGATLWLAQRPAFVELVAVTVASQRLGDLAATLRQLLATGMVRGVMKISSDYALMMSAYASAVRAGGVPALPPLVRLGSERSWQAVVPIFGDDRRELAHRASYIIKKLRRGAERVTTTGILRSEGARGVFTGQPMETLVDALYWRHAPPVPARPEPWRDRRGVMFCCPAVPFTGADLRRVTRMLERALLAHGFEPYLTLNLMDERVVHVVAAVFYDRAVPGDDARARAAYDRAFAACVARGYYPYRLGIQSAGRLPPAIDDSDELLRRIGRALDPSGVLSDNRYKPSQR